jgi:flagellar basal-body rod modification protein FlgD
MTEISSIGTASPTEGAFGSKNTLNDLDLDAFLNLMIAELQNQDPLNPMENDELLAQISQIREVGATDRLTETLDAVLLGQNISSATNLIGAQISALSDDNERVDGMVDRISIANGQPKLHLDLASTAQASTKEGQIETGTYQYRVVWEDQSGTLLGVDPLQSKGGSITVGGIPGIDQSIALGNLPLTNVTKQVYRTDNTGQGPLHLVGTIPNGQTGTFLDTASVAQMSSKTLTTTPQLVESTKGHTVSLNNVGEIKPPRA